MSPQPPLRDRARAAFFSTLRFVLFFSAVVLVPAAMGVRGIVSPSVPRGLYLSRSIERELERGDTVTFCLPAKTARFAKERGYINSGAFCPGGTGTVTKAIFALPGDTVTLTAEGLLWRGDLLPNTKPRPTDRGGRAVPVLQPGRYVVPARHVWLFTVNHPGSFDSRYYGPIPDSLIRSLYRPLWTEGSAETPPDLKNAHRDAPDVLPHP